MKLSQSRANNAESPDFIHSSSAPPCFSPSPPASPTLNTLWLYLLEKCSGEVERSGIIKFRGSLALYTSVTRIYTRGGGGGGESNFCRARIFIGSPVKSLSGLRLRSMQKRALCSLALCSRGIRSIVQQQECEVRFLRGRGVVSSKRLRYCRQRRRRVRGRVVVVPLSARPPQRRLRERT